MGASQGFFLTWLRSVLFFGLVFIVQKIFIAVSVMIGWQ